MLLVLQCMIWQCWRETYTAVKLQSMILKWSTTPTQSWLTLFVAIHSLYLTTTIEILSPVYSVATEPIGQLLQVTCDCCAHVITIKIVFSRYIFAGAVIGNKKKIFDDNHLQFHKKLPNLVKIIDSQWFQENLADELALQDGENINTSLIYLYGKQGKSARYRLWSLNSLSTSNSNLKEYDPKRDWNWLHCPYNLEDTLCNKYMVLHF